MKIGIIGLKNSGKTTIFNALTGLKAETALYSGGKVEPNLGTVEVKDPRVTRLSEIYQPKKTVYTHIEFIDFVFLGIGNKYRTVRSYNNRNVPVVKNAFPIDIFTEAGISLEFYGAFFIEVKETLCI